jgi:radical SAM superfamily enzyme YgiQ (UPF0313 family)
MKLLLLRHPEEWIQPGILGHLPNVSSIYPPLGLEYIGASLEREGHKVEIIDFGAEAVSKEQLKNSLMTSDTVGMSIYTNNYKNAANTAKVIKELEPEIPLIIGGPHCSFLKKRSLSDIPDADIAVELEGEFVIIDLIKYIQGRKKMSDIHGVYYRDKNRIKSGRPFKIIEDLDSLPFPARHLVDKYDYGNFPGGYQAKKKFTSMITSRGCPFRCRFCVRYSNIKKGYRFRGRSAKNVIEEIQEINDKYGSVAIVDDNFLADTKRAHRIFDRLLEIGTNIDLSIVGARIDSADRTLYKKMKKANVKLIAYGIESGNQDVLDFYNKKITLQQIREAVQLGREMNFIIQGTFILGAPIETKEHIEKTIKFICSLPIDTVIIRPLLYEMGSDLWIEAVKNKKISKDDYSVTADSRRDLGNFTPEELDEYSKKAFRRFYLRPKYIFSQIYRASLQKDNNQLKNVLGSVVSTQWTNIL